MQTDLPADYFNIDYETNHVTVRGCTLPEFLDDRPTGELNFHYIKLPDYVTSTDPVEIFAYSDVSMQNLIFDESGPGRGAIL